MPYRFQVSDTAALIQRATMETMPLIQKKQIMLRQEVGKDFSTLVCDPDKILQVLINLLSNAIKFTDENGSIAIQCSATDATAEIAIQDSGIGIPESELETVFDKFVQSSKTKNGAGGTGLGLAICREIVQAHHGKIWAENNPQGGARFILRLPLNPLVFE
jgi:signal transduction histidine kinase